MVHDMHLMQVKTPKESKDVWDYLKLVATQPAYEITRPQRRLQQAQADRARVS